MFILPVGHEQDELRRWPWVSIGFVALCFLVFLGIRVAEGGAERRVLARAREVFEYAVDKTYLVVEEDLLFGDTAELAAEVGLDADWAPEVAPPPATQLRIEQGRLEILTAEWRRAHDAVPLRALGLVPAELEATDLITHFLAHAGWVHLLGNLFFFWMAGPPLEDVWGRWLYALFLLAVGVSAGLLWAARYPHSMEPVVGASGAVAGLMGGFMIRFWRTRIQCLWVVWMSLKIYTGSFKAPAWLMLSVWLGYQIAFATWLEPHTMPVGGVALWAHVFGFGAGALLALAIRVARIEERWVASRILAATGEEQNRVIEEVHVLLEKGQRRRAWELLQQEVEGDPENWDAILEWWELAETVGRQAQVAPHLVEVIRHELATRQWEVARWHWADLRQGAPRHEVPADLYLRLAEVVLEEEADPEEIASLLASARAELGADPPIGLLVRLARVSAKARMPGARGLCRRVADDQRAPEQVRSEFRELSNALDKRRDGDRPCPVDGATTGRKEAS